LFILSIERRIDLGCQPDTLICVPQVPAIQVKEPLMDHLPVASIIGIHHGKAQGCHRMPHDVLGRRKAQCGPKGMNDH
jgi:hypothetical protein